MKNKYSILVVEDDFLSRRMMGRLLETELSRELKSPIEILNASNGKEAMQLLDNDLDLVLTDTNMPEMDGVELLAWTKIRGLKTPVAILFSGYPRNPKLTKKDLMNMGAATVLSKGMVASEIIGEVLALLTIWS